MFQRHRGERARNERIDASARSVEPRRHAARGVAVASPPVSPSPARVARAAGLRHVSDDQPGFRRRRAGRGFSYVRPGGEPVRDKAALARIRALAIPPAWRDVWICPDPQGHLQATGRDARGRKQYRYHGRWREARDATKYHRTIAFAKALPRIRRRVGADLRRPGLPREKVLATVVALLERTLIRVGNEEYAKDNGSFGLTTLRDRHVRFRGAKAEFVFTGKGGKRHEVELFDRRLARVVRACRDLPGQELFQYVDDEGAVQSIGSADVNGYLREVAGEEFTAKDVRTWAGTVLAAIALQEAEAFETRAQARRNVTAAIERVAKQLGNTPTICRRCYVHPAVLEAYEDGAFAEAMGRRVARWQAAGGLAPEERAVLALLERRLARPSTTRLLAAALSRARARRGSATASRGGARIRSPPPSSR